MGGSTWSSSQPLLLVVCEIRRRRLPLDHLVLCVSLIGNQTVFLRLSFFFPKVIRWRWLVCPQTGEELEVVEAHGKMVQDLEMYPDRTCFLTCSLDKTAKVRMDPNDVCRMGTLGDELEPSYACSDVPCTKIPCHAG